MKSMKNFIFILFFAFSVVSLTLSPVSASSLSSSIKIDLVNSSATLKKQKSLITEIKAGKIIGKVGGKALTTGVKAGLRTGFKTGVKSLKNSAKTIGKSAKKVGGSVKASVQKFNFFKPQTKTVPKKITKAKPSHESPKTQTKKSSTNFKKTQKKKVIKSLPKAQPKPQIKKGTKQPQKQIAAITKDKKGLAKKLSKHRVILPKKSLTHILDGNINKYGQGVGGHYAKSKNIRIRKIVHSTDKNGVFVANIKIRNPKTGKFVNKKSPSSLYPKEWSRRKTQMEIESAFRKRKPWGRNGWEGISISGIKIRGYTKSDGAISTAFPIHTKKP